MILTNESESGRYLEEGTWGRKSLSDLLARNAKARPDDVCLVATGTARGSGPTSFSWAELAARVERMADFLGQAGLSADEIVVTQFPNTTDAVIAHLAILRAGLIVAAMPPAWRRRELTAAAEQIAPAALMTSTPLEGTDHAMIMREVAAETLSVRHVFAFGADVPDGVYGLDESAPGSVPYEGTVSPPRPGNPADHVALITFDASVAPPRPVARSHNHLLASATMVVLAARLGHDATLATTMAPSSLPALASGLAAWLLSGSRLMILSPADVMEQRGNFTDATHLVLPGRAAEALFPSDAGPRPIRIWRNESPPRTDSDGNGIEVIALGEVALWAARGGCAIPIGQTEDSPPQARLLSARIDGTVHRAGESPAPGAFLSGALSVSGPQVPCPEFPPVNPVTGSTAADGYQQTGLRGLLVNARPASVRISGTTRELAARGGLTVPIEEIDGIYAGFPGAEDAAALVLPDPVMGTRLRAAVACEPGSDCSLEAFHAYLHEAGAGAFLLPDQIVEVDKIPRGGDGSILRSLLNGGTAA